MVTNKIKEVLSFNLPLDVICTSYGIIWRDKPEQIKGLKFKNKKAAAFGCYGWSGESTKIISENLKAAGFELVDDGIKALWNPDNENITKCIEYGRQLVAKVHL